MLKAYGVAITDGKNRKNHIIPLRTLENAYHDSWNRIIPVHIGHDRTKPVGYSKMSGIYMEPGKAYGTNESAIIETEQENEQLLRFLSNYNYSVFCEEHKDEIEQLKNELKEYLSEEYKVAPIGQAVAIRDKEIVKRLFPEWVDTFKDGLVNARELQPVYSTTTDGERGVLIPGVYEKDGFLLFAHYFFRRNMSILNTTNEEFFDVFEKIKEETDVDIKLALDLDMVGLLGTENSEVEYQYIRGPHFNDDLRMIPEGVTCHNNEHYDNVFSNLLSTQFYWHIQDGKRTFECEELCDKENISFNEGKDMLWGCRYVHSMLDPVSGKPIHLDGAIRIYDDVQILERIDDKTDISKCGKNSKYKKLWRIDNDIPIHLWKQLISSFYRENALIGEYFGGIDEKYDAIVSSDNAQKRLESEKNPFSFMEFNPGDGMRLFLTYLDKFDIQEQRDIKLCGYDYLLMANGEKVKVLDAESITLLKLIKRKGVLLKMPNTSIIAYNDMIYNFPVFCCKDNNIVDIVLGAIKELCSVWEKQGKDALISFGIRTNFENDSCQISFAGHINDFILLFDNIPSFSSVDFNDWIDDIYAYNNEFKLAENRPEKYELIYGDVVRFRRILVPQSKIEQMSLEDGDVSITPKLEKDEAAYLAAHKIEIAPHFRIKQSICDKCGNEYRSCDCIKFLDDGVTETITKADMFRYIWTNRNIFFQNSEVQLE